MDSTSTTKGKACKQQKGGGCYVNLERNAEQAGE